jgi:hypothetical protein
VEQQLGPRVTQLEARVATLEDEGKILKGEVKTILTEIRTAILARENPFEGGAGTPQSAPLQIVPAAPEPVARPEIVAPAHEERAEPAPHAPASSPAHAAPRAEPTPIHPPSAAPVVRPSWSLLTIAGLSAWAEDAMRRLGPLRLEILLDLCQASGHLTDEARAALSRVIELDVEEPERAPSSNETVVLLRQLEALLHEDEAPERIQRAA